MTSFLKYLVLYTQMTNTCPKLKKKDTNIIFENAYVCLYDAFWLAYILVYLQGPCY